MALEVKELDCPTCGASLSVRNARKARVLVCHQCGSQIDLTSPEHEIIGKAILGSAPPKSPIRLGQIATLDGVEWMVVGRVRYDDEGYWDEWLLMSEDGKYQWLVESDGFTLYQPFVPTNPVDPNSVGSRVDLEGISAKVGEKGQATITYLEGELTWKARVGDVMNYLDAKHRDGVYSIEWTEREIEFFRGQRISKSAVYKAFGFKKPRARRRKKVRRAAKDISQPVTEDRSVVVMAAAITLFVVFIILVSFCLICGCLPAGTGRGDTPSSGSTWTPPAPSSSWDTPTPWSSGGPSIRIGSPGGGGTSGGFSGGK